MLAVGQGEISAGKELPKGLGMRAKDGFDGKSEDPFCHDAAQLMLRYLADKILYSRA